MKNKIIVVSYSRIKGGAAIAANNFCSLFKKVSSSLVFESITQDKAGGFQFFKRLISFILIKTQIGDSPIKHSLNLFSYSALIKSFCCKDNKIFHMHWVNNDTLSVFDFDKIPSGSIITLHDEWFYCGAEHYYKIDDPELDFITGYHLFKKRVWGINWNFIIWKIKLYKLKNRTDIIYTVPSSWMLSRASKSLILRNADIRLLPNPIDVDVFSPSSLVNTNRFISSIGSSRDDIILLFGAYGGKASYLKGSHLLDEALKILSIKLSSDLISKVKLVDFGGKLKDRSTLYGFDSISLGHIADHSKLSLIYSSSSFVVVPSLVESFGQVAAEALSCETPVVCFNYSGVTDIVIDGYSGATADSFCSKDLADKIYRMILLDAKERKFLGENGRKFVEDKFSHSVIAQQYSKIIDDAIALKSHSDH
jgi:glycosyltransferase involved in cell wall biosynthesis